jgi:hypothetical protein
MKAEGSDLQFGATTARATLFSLADWLHQGTDKRQHLSEWAGHVADAGDRATTTGQSPLMEERKG